MLFISLLGKPRLTIDSVPLAVNAPPKTIPLLAYLLLHRNQEVDRQQVAFTLWPDDSESDARANLRRHLHHLQRLLPVPAADQPWLLITPSSLRWNPNCSYWLDIADFEAKSSSFETLTAAVPLYTGDLLETCYEDWLLFDRERLRDRYLETLSRLVNQCRVDGKYTETLSYAQLLLTRDPFREDILRQVLSVRYEAGDRAGALAEYDRFSAHLSREMGVAPMPETQSLVEIILRHGRLPGANTPLTPPAEKESLSPHHLPDLLPFVGRQVEMERFSARWDRLLHGQGGLLLVSGEAGVGKSRLMREATLFAEQRGARILLGGFTPGVTRPYQAVIEVLQAALPLLAAIEGENTRLSALLSILPELASRRTLTPLPPIAADQEQMRLFDAVAGCLIKLSEPRPLLLIFEDLHWAESSSLALIEFIARRAAGSRCLVAATYREEEIPREHALRAIRRRLQAEHLLDSLSLQRLVPDAVKTVFAGLNFSPDEVKRIISTSEGNPLFLSLILQHWNTGNLEESVLPVTLQDAILRRLACLSSTSRTYAEVAAILGTDFDFEAVREIGGWSDGQSLDALDDLLDHQIVCDADHSLNYHFVHHLIQSVLYTSIPESKRRSRHRRAGDVLESLYPDRHQELAGVLAVHFDRGGDPARAIPAYFNAAGSALAVYADDEAISLLSRAIDLANIAGEPTCPRTLRMELLFLRESIYHRLANRTLEWEDLGALQALIHPDDPLDIQCRFYQAKVAYYRELGQRSEERMTLDQFLAAAAADPLWKATALLCEGGYFELIGAYQSALENYARAIELYQLLGDEDGVCRCMMECAEIQMFLGNVDEMEGWITRVQSLPGQLEQTDQSLNLYYVISSHYRHQNEHEKAIEYAQRLLKLAEKVNSFAKQALAHRLLGQSYNSLFRVAEARHHFESALQTYRLLQRPNGEAATLGGMASLACDLGRLTEAYDLYAAAYAIGERIQNHDLCIRELINLGCVCAYMADFAGEKEKSLAALELNAGKNTLLQCYALGNLGEAERNLGEIPAAVEHLTLAWQSYQQIKREQDGRGALADLALAVLAAGDQALAREYACQLENMFTAMEGVEADVQRMLWAALKVWDTLGEKDRAAQLAVRASKYVEQQANRIPDEESRRAFYSMVYHREILSYLP